MLYNTAIDDGHSLGITNQNQLYFREPRNNVDNELKMNFLPKLYTLKGFTEYTEGFSHCA